MGAKTQSANKVYVINKEFNGNFLEPETEEERVVLSVLKSGVEDYNELVNILETDGDMPEWETLSTLKELGLKLPGKKPKFVIWYPCYFLLYNSKSAPQLRTSLRVTE